MSTRVEVEPRDQPVLGALAVIAILLTLPVLMLASGPRLVDVVGVVIAAVLALAGRDSPHALAALGVVALLWASSSAGPTSPWTLVFAALLFVAHAAMALRSAIPPGAELNRDLARRWAARSAVVLGITAIVYLAALALQHLPHARNEEVIAVALLLLAGGLLLLRHEILGRVRS